MQLSWRELARVVIPTPESAPAMPQGSCRTHGCPRQPGSGLAPPDARHSIAARSAGRLAVDQSHPNHGFELHDLPLRSPRRPGHRSSAPSHTGEHIPATSGQSPASLSHEYAAQITTRRSMPPSLPCNAEHLGRSVSSALRRIRRRRTTRPEAVQPGYAARVLAKMDPDNDDVHRPVPAEFNTNHDPNGSRRGGRAIP